MKIDLGGALNCPAGYESVDLRNAKFILDLEDAHLPFGDETIEEIRAHHILEHIRNLCPLLDECWRVLKDGGIMEIEVPKYPDGAAVHDPTHIRFFTANTFDYFTRLTYFNYLKHYWEYEDKENPIKTTVHGFLNVRLKKCIPAS